MININEAEFNNNLSVNLKYTYLSFRIFAEYNPKFTSYLYLNLNILH